MAALIPEFPLGEMPKKALANTFNDFFGRHMFHSHHSLGGSTPSFDISESDGAYFLDGDFPGIANKEEISLKWSGKRTLIVEAYIPKPDYETEWNVTISNPLGRVEKHDKAMNGEGIDGKAENGSSLKDRVPHLKHRESSTPYTGIRHYVQERHTGHLYRLFTFPEDVETYNVKAKLQQGQLKLMVPKSEPMHPNNSRIVIGE